MSIHPTAIVDPKAMIESGVKIGPWCFIGPDVKIGKDTELANNVTVVGHTQIGEGNTVGQYSVIGGPPQDLKYHNEPTLLVIGNKNTIRECVTINVGTKHGGGITRVGDGNFLMACCHVAHDCHIHNKTVIPNGVLLAGHVEVEDSVVLSGLVGINHFSSIGKCAFIGGLTRVIHDVPPFMLLEGHPSKVRTINRVGLERNGYSPEAIRSLKEAHRLLYRKGLPHNKAFKKIEESEFYTEEVKYLLDFIKRADDGVQGRARQPKPVK